MTNTTTFFLFFLIIILLPSAYGLTSTGTAIVLEADQIGGNNEDEVILDNDSTFDVSGSVKNVDETTKTIGSVEVDLTQEVEFIATVGDVITIINTELPTVSVEIPDQTVLSAPDSWDNTITPPVSVEVSGIIPSGFQTPDSVIQVGSPDVILIFDKAVTILLEGTTGQIAYKLSGEDTWNLIGGCSGTYANPIIPVFPNECSIGNGEDTKILTHHFTEFAGLEEIEGETVEETTIKSSSGAGRTGIISSSSGFNDEIKSSNVLPIWLKQPVLWWNDDQITDQEFSSIMGWLIDENIIKIEDKTKPEKQIITMAPSTKHLFSLWGEGILPEYMILNLVETYREYGVW